MICTTLALGWTNAAPVYLPADKLPATPLSLKLYGPLSSSTWPDNSGEVVTDSPGCGCNSGSGKEPIFFCRLFKWVLDQLWIEAPRPSYWGVMVTWPLVSGEVVTFAGGPAMAGSRK